MTDDGDDDGGDDADDSHDDVDLLTLLAPIPETT